MPCIVRVYTIDMCPAFALLGITVSKVLTGLMLTKYQLSWSVTRVGMHVATKHLNGLRIKAFLALFLAVTFKRRRVCLAV